jgi:HPt (histidine-containing phosphotransfer) domain-containing protein
MADLLRDTVLSRERSGPTEATSRPEIPALAAESGAAEAGLFDRRETLARMDGDWELFREVAGIFAADSKMMMAQIRDAIAAGDPPGLNRAAHTLKGAISNFGAPAPFELALKLEQLGKSGELAGARQKCQALEVELERLRKALESCAGRMGA